jgi:phage terminase large subunit-like protein
MPLIKKMVKDPTVFTTRGSTFDNANNLAATFIAQIQDRYGGTRLGRQELEGEILSDIPGALWNRSDIDEHRVYDTPDLERIIVAVDPATSSHEGSDETGIVGVGMARDPDGYARGYVLADKSLRGSPEEWARKAVSLYRELQADRIVAEKNQGGDMVASVIRSIDRSVPITLVHASRGKIIRAEPVSALYEQGRIHHVGRHDKLEDQMCTFSVDNVRDSNTGSPDRVDALVWGFTELFEKITARRRAPNMGRDAIVQQQEYLPANAGLNSPTSWMAG